MDAAHRGNKQSDGEFSDEQGADDGVVGCGFVSYYSRALQGEFFKNKDTLNEYRRILSLGDAIWLLPLPLGGSAFCKGGSIDVPGFHAVCAPGGMVFEDRWVYFAFIINWQAAAVTDPQTVAVFVKAAAQAMTIVKDALATT